PWPCCTLGIRSTAALASIFANEGQTATNNGTWSDPGVNDNVTPSASVGAVRKTANGTWSWSFATSDGPAQSQTVTITATDKDGATATTTFTLGVTNVAPAVSAGGNATLFTGDTLSRGGSFADPGADTWTAPVHYGDGSGTTMAVARTAGNAAGVVLTHAYTAEGTYTVTVTATDKNGLTSAAASLTVAITITAIETDPDGKTVLAVGGTTGDDTIAVKLR